MAERTLIKNLKPSQYVDGVYAVNNCQLGQTKAGKPFLKCLLSDRSGRTPGRMWNASQELFQQLPTDGFVRVAGQTQPYQGEIQIIIDKIQAIEPSPEDLEQLLPTTSRDVEQMFAEVSAKLGAVKHESLRALVQVYLGDERLMKAFRRAPAAMSLHHAFLGGLLEHTLNLMCLAEVVCPLYPHLNGELVLVGLFLHDLGKCDELTWESGFNYTEDGQLVGHITRGAIWLEAKADACAAAGTQIPRSLLRVLHHMILSHHGLLEYGAVKVPATPEAIAVSMLDNMDAKMYMALAATRQDEEGVERGGDFTEKIWALGTRLYRPDPAVG
jgi:3'-5' exoribonuclease